MTIYFLGTLTLILPIALILWLSLSPVNTRLDLLLRSFFVGCTIFIFYKIGLWSLTSFYLRYFLIVIFSVSFIYLLYKNLKTPSFHRTFLTPGNYLLFPLSILSFILSIFVSMGSTYKNVTSTELAFPFSQGNYLILQGGSNFTTNPFHQQATSASFALDIIKLNPFGNRASHFYPVQLNQYNIFNENILSPCNGIVIEAVDDQIDNKPQRINTRYPAGNHLILHCNNVKVLLAHLKQNSIRVSSGNSVSTGQVLASVGNSGYTDEPHLHIQVNQLDNKPVAILFNNHSYSINDLYTAWKSF